MNSTATVAMNSIATVRAVNSIATVAMNSTMLQYFFFFFELTHKLIWNKSMWLETQKKRRI